MAQIKIKRGPGTPSGLTFGELAYDLTNRRLYVGVTGGNVLLAPTDGGVATFNGSTGAVTGVSLLNGFTGGVTLAAGTNVSISGSANTITISATGLSAAASDFVTQGRLVGNTASPNGTDFNIPFTAQHDPQNWWNASTKRFTPTISGYYDVSMGVWWGAGSTTGGQVNIQGRKNGTSFALVQNNLDNRNGLGQGWTKVVSMNGSTDYLEFTSYTSNPVSQELNAGTNNEGVWFKAFLISNNTPPTAYVSSFNGLTGAVTGVTTGTANTFGPLQTFTSGISSSGGTFASGQVSIKNLRMLGDTVSEGGQIDFALAGDNTGLCGPIAIDIYQNKVRIFETTGTNRGVFIDLTGVSAGVGTNLVGGGGGAVSSVSGSGSGISVSPTTGAVVVQNTGVHSFNGLTGTVTGVTTGTANTFGPLQSFTNGISASGGTFTNLIVSNAYIDVINTRSGADLNVYSGANANINLDTTGIVTVGDASGNFNGTTLVVRDGTNTVTANGQLVSGGAFTANSTITAGGIIRANAGLSAAGSTFTGQVRFVAGLCASGGTFSGTQTFVNGLTSSSNINLQNTEYLQNTTNGRVDIMPAPAGSTAFGMYLDLTSWSFGVIMGTIRSSDGAINTGGNLRFDVPLTVLNDTQLQMGQDGQYSFYRSTVGNDTGQIRAYCDGVNNSGAWAIVGYFDSGTTNRSPTTKHANPNLYIYANGNTYANDFVRFEHDRTNANIISGGTSGIFIQPGSGQLGVSGGISAGAYILSASGINTLTGTTYSLQSSDNGEILTMNNASPITVTVPSGLPVGYSVTVIQLGAGQVSFSASGTTINSYLGYTKIAGQHGSASLVSYSSNVFNLAGSLSA